MQKPGLQGWTTANVPTIASHTLCSWEIARPSADDDIQYPSGLPCTPGPDSPQDMFGVEPLCPHTRVKMGQTLSSSSSSYSTSPSPPIHLREKAHKPSSTILREDSIIRQVEEYRVESDPCLASDEFPLPPLSREDSYSIHCGYTDQAPYSNVFATDGPADKMMTQQSLLHLPKDNATRDLAFFLRTTGPSAPHRKPSKVETRPSRAVGAPKNALRFLRFGAHRKEIRTRHGRVGAALRDAGGLLDNTEEHPVPNGVQQKSTSSGQRYLALQVPESDELDLPFHHPSEPLTLGPGILESRVSVCFHHENVNSSEVLDEWLSALSKEQAAQDTVIIPMTSGPPPASLQEVASPLTTTHPASSRPSASRPATPEPAVTAPAACSCSGALSERIPAVSADDAGVSVIPDNSGPRTSSPTPVISLPKEEFPVKHPRPQDEVEIKHPLPRRLGSRPILLQRTSSTVSTLYGSRSASDSPGPPPPRSALRLRREPRTIEGINSNDRSTETKSTPKIAPKIQSSNGPIFGIDHIRATVTTECTGPIKRPRSPSQDSTRRRKQHSSSRKDRDERLRARKLRDRPTVTRTIDAVVHAPAQATRQRLKKLRPQLQIPYIQPSSPDASHVSNPTRASSDAGVQNPAQPAPSPKSPVPPKASRASNDDKTGYTPISATASTETQAAQGGAKRQSPVTLVAEQVPLLKTKTASRPARLIVKEGKTYAPRPRSASVPRTAASAKRRSRGSVHNSGYSSPRSKSPERRRRVEQDDDVPPLPSPPPSRALPPTPPASVSERPGKGASKVKAAESKTDASAPFPAIPGHDGGSAPATEDRRLPHISTQRKSTAAPPQTRRSDHRAASRVDARLEALERQNALLSAALVAVLRTNGALNGTPMALPLPLPGLQEQEVAKGPMAWECRVARRSAATASSHTASSSNGSALEMYMSTRQGSRHGY